MIQRCGNPNCRTYSKYGAKGIRVCRRWRKFTNFLSDLGERPKGKYSLGRFLDLGDYKPGNCKWMTQQEQIDEAHKKRLMLKGEK